MNAQILPTDHLEISIVQNQRWLDVAIPPGTGERLFSVLWGAGFFDAASGLRTSLTVALDPPLGLISSSATAAAAVGVALAYGSN